MGISSADPHETSLVHLGEPRDLKGLLHMLNATAIPGKVSLVLRLEFFFILLEDEQKAGCGGCLLYTSPSPRDGLLSRMPSSA